MRQLAGVTKYTTPLHSLSGGNPSITVTSPDLNLDAKNDVLFAYPPAMSISDP